MAVTRNIALTDPTYDLLATRRRPGQSFSDVVAELLEHGRPRLADVAGVAGDDEHWRRFAQERRKRRSESLHRVDLES